MTEWTLFDWFRFGVQFLLVCFFICCLGFAWWYAGDKAQDKKDRL